MDSQKTVKKAEEFFNIKSETPLDPFAVDIFGAEKSAVNEEREIDVEAKGEAEKTHKKAKERPVWNASLPVLTTREVEFSRLLQNLPKNLTSRAAAAIEETIALYTFQSAADVKCRLASVSEVNLSEAIGKRAQTAQVFMTLGCQPDNAAAVIALNADFASAVIDLILGGEVADYTAPGDLSSIEIVVFEFLSINILSEINRWLGQPILCLQKVTSTNPSAFESFERGAESVFQLNVNSYGGALNFFSGWSFLNGLDKTENPLFEKRSFARQFKNFEKIVPKLNLRVPIGTTRLTSDNLLYLEPDDVILIEETENALAGGDFSGVLQIYVGSGKNIRLSGTSLSNEIDKNGELIFKINEIINSEEQQNLTPTKLTMDEKEIEEIEETEETEEFAGDENAPDGTNQADGAPFDAENAAILSNVLVTLRVEIAGGKISLNELQNLRSGQIVPLGCRPTDPVRIMTDSSDQPVAGGELVDVEGRLGVRVTRVFI